ncbi:MAG: glutamate-5-semialdehyde dehydrogenase [Desulfovibrionaceae bacterium]
MSLATYIQNIGQQAKKASRLIAAASPAAKNNALLYLADLLDQRRPEIQAANARDVKAALAGGMDKARCDRLTITPAIISEMIHACRHIAALPDPVGAMEKQWQQPNGLLVGRMRVPLGVIAMIYEARPNVTIDAAILCLKAGNAVILRGGSEALHSNLALASLLHEALIHANLTPEAAQVLDITDRNAVTALCKLDTCIDVIIPRGGENLVRVVCEAATMPVLKHYKGVCHLFVDADAPLVEAVDIAFNSKVQRPAACNALECILVHVDSADAFLPLLLKKLGPAGVQFKACPRAFPLLQHAALLGASAPLKPYIHMQEPTDLGMEFHDLTLAICVVDSLDTALDHIAAHGSRHTEVICTNSYSHAQRFLREADASMVAVNASTRFNDGGQLGLGAEIGISTSKLHAYGPMGVEELTTTKFVVTGQGQVRI